MRSKRGRSDRVENKMVKKDSVMSDISTSAMVLLEDHSIGQHQDREQSQKDSRR